MESSKMDWEMGKKILIMLVLFSIQISMAFAYDIEGGEITFVRADSPYIDFGYVPPEYLSTEDLVFYTCIQEDNTPIKSTVLCVDENSFRDLEVVRWGDDNCYMATYDMEEMECENLLIESEYLKNDEIVKISRPLKVNRFSSILDHVLQTQYSDGGWKNAIDTAAGIWILSNYSEIFDDEISLAMDWLKEHRDNDLKCWPDEECSVAQTAKIMAFLTLAEVNDSSRIIHDGQVYLRKWQNYYQLDEEWNLSIRPFESGTTNCIISYERDHLNNEEFDIEENETEEYLISAYPEGELILICDQNIYANLTTVDNDLVFIYEGDNLSYTLPYPCWPLDEKWRDCDLRTTEFAMMSDLPEEHEDVGQVYLDSQLRTGRIGEQYLASEQNVLETALYTYLADSSDEEDTTIAWLRFRQNNNGSWGNGTIYDKIHPTGYGILGLMESGFTRNNEVIEDAERWISYQDYLLSGNKTSDYEGWNSTENDALAFIVLRNNARPMLKFKPMVVVLDTALTEIEVYNPTTFPLEEITYEFSSEIEDYVGIVDEKEEIPAYSYVKLKFERTKADTGNKYGYITIKNQGDEIAKAPVMVVNFPDIDITVKQQSVIVFGTASRIEFDVTKTAHTFSCSLEWDDDDISSKKDYNINGKSFTVDVSFSDAERIEKTYDGTFTCTTGDNTFTLPFSVDFSRYSTFPFTVEPESITINSTNKDEVFIITNKLDESLDVEIKFAKSEKTFSLSQTALVIDPNDRVNITIFNNAGSDENITTINTIQVSALGETKTINFHADIEGGPQEETSAWLLYLVILVVLGALGGLGYLAYLYKDLLLSYFRKEEKADMIKLKIRKMEEREKNTAIKNMVQILRMLNKDDGVIRKRLLDEGFKEKEIDDALNAQEEEGEKKEEKKEDQKKDAKPKK